MFKNVAQSAYKYMKLWFTLLYPKYWTLFNNMKYYFFDIFSWCLVISDQDTIIKPCKNTQLRCLYCKKELLCKHFQIRLYSIFNVILNKLGHSRKDLYPPPWRKLAIPPSPSLDILYKFKTFFGQFPLPGQQKFPLWVGYGSFFEWPNINK